jgi:hypothetical protein
MKHYLNSITVLTITLVLFIVTVMVPKHMYLLLAFCGCCAAVMAFLERLIVIFDSQRRANTTYGD